MNEALLERCAILALAQMKSVVEADEGITITETPEEAWAEGPEEHKQVFRDLVLMVLEEAAKEAEAVELPGGFQWSESNVSKFKFGAKRAADAIRGLEYPCPGHIASDADPKICRFCATHIDELRPEPEGE